MPFTAKLNETSCFYPIEEPTRILHSLISNGAFGNGAEIRAASGRPAAHYIVCGRQFALEPLLIPRKGLIRFRHYPADPLFLQVLVAAADAQQVLGTLAKNIGAS
jgi:hypothetical protein